MGWDLPDGVRESDLPGNGPFDGEDEEVEEGVCPCCRGRGFYVERREQWTCRACNGTGQTASEEDSYLDDLPDSEQTVVRGLEPVTDHVECWLCSGSCEWLGRGCPRCSARGHVPAWHDAEELRIHEEWASKQP